MRTYLLFFFTLLIASTTYGQTSLSEDFESYNVGDGIAETSPDFILWPAPAATDAFVSDLQAASGTKSLRLPGGEDVDVLYNLGQQFTEGSFVYSMDVFIPTGNNAYFNFQGSDQVGVTGNWVLQCYLRQNGLFQVDNGGGGFLFENGYPQNEWINIKLDVNLTNNLWRMFVNDECLGSFTQRDDGNSIFSVNLFPDSPSALSYVDNISFEHSPDAAAVNIDLDASFAFLDMDTDIGLTQSQFYGLTGTQQNAGLGIINLGTTDITSLGVTLDLPGSSLTRDIDVNIPAGAGQLVPFFEPIEFTNGDQIGTFSITSVNGMSDDNTCNDKGPIIFSGFTPEPGRKVFVEESTGVQCPWCPRGAVYMDYMYEKYGDLFVGVASHDSDQGFDPMTNDRWNSGITAIAANPSNWVDRDSASVNGFGHTVLESIFADKITQEALVLMSSTASWDATTRELSITVNTEFPLVAFTDGKLLLGLTEDGVTNPDPSYSQTNNYGGGAAGPMAGYENLPNLIPADQMVYNHVMRLGLTPSLGLTGAYAGVTGNTAEHNFTVPIPAEWDITKMNIVAAFVNPQNGSVVNSSGTKVSDFLSGTNDVDPYLSGAIAVSPNPTNGLANITVNFETAKPVQMTVADAMGKVVTVKDYGLITGNETLSFDGSDLNAGIYYLHFRSENNIAIKKLMISK